MPRERKDGKYINLRIEKSVYKRFDDYCKKESRTKTAALEKMISTYLDQYDKYAKKRRTLYD